MNLDPRARRLLDMLALATPMEGGEAGLSDKSAADRRREGFARLMQMGAKSVDLASITDIETPGPGGPLTIRLYDRETNRPRPAPALIYFHGGGLVAGSLATHDGICRKLAEASGVVVAAADYRLAPEARFPASLEDAAFACEWLAQRADDLRLDHDRLAVGGDSVGALLASLIGNGHHPVTPVLKAQVLLCPVIDLASKTGSRGTFANGYLIDEATIACDISLCLEPGMDLTTLPSPLRHGDLSRTPPTIIDSAEYDPFRDEAAAYAKALQDHAVPVWHKCHPGMVHVFQGLGGFFPQSEEALEEVGSALARLLT